MISGMSFWQNFKKFAMRGNAMDLAVGVVVGGAFGKIVTSLVNDVLLPPLGLVLGRVDFSNLFLVLGPGSYATLAEAKKAGVPILAYGSFLSSILDFVIIALSIFLMLQWLAKLRLLPSMSAPQEEPPPTRAEKLLEEIRNELRGRGRD